MGVATGNTIGVGSSLTLGAGVCTGVTSSNVLDE